MRRMQCVSTIYEIIDNPAQIKYIEALIFIRVSLMLISFILFLIVIGFLCFIQASPKLWVFLVVLSLLDFSLYSRDYPELVMILWIVCCIPIAFVILGPVRRQFFSKPFMNYFKRVLPPMSVTEREALEAGDTWFEGDLFSGRPNWSKLHAILKPILSKEEQAFLDNEVNTLCSMIDDWKMVHELKDMSPEVWNYLKQNGFFGLVIERKYSGKGFSAYAHSCIVTKIASRSFSAAINTMVPNSLGPGELLQHYGTDVQKNYYLPRLAKGEEVPCFALTSLESGSDAGAMMDTGFISKGIYNGEEVLGITLTWSKRYITLAPVATLIGLAFKLYDPENLVGQEKDIGITVALLPASHPGVKNGERHYPLGLAFMNGPTEGDKVFIPLEFVIGGPKMLGKGWRMLMECLSIGRSISLPGLSLATAQLAYFTTGIYAHLRKQFKVSIGEFEGIQEKLASIAGFTYLLEASVRMTASAVDLQVKPSVVSAIQKYHATEIGRKIADMMMDVHGGRGIQLGPRNYAGYVYQVMPVAITVEGANILTRNLIIFGQGAIRCHPFVLREMEALNQNDHALEAFDAALLPHIGYVVSNVFRTVCFGLTGARFAKAPRHARFEHYYRQLTRMSSALALVSDLAMLKLGGALKRKERLSARLGDVLSHLYLASTLLKYHADEGYAPADELALQWGLDYCLFEIQTAFEDFFQNFPGKILSKILLVMIFPWGASYKKPSDRIEAALARSMMKPSALRARMTSLVYVPKNAPDDVLGRLQVAFEKNFLASDAEKKVLKAVQAGVVNKKLPWLSQIEETHQKKMISLDEKNLLLEAHHLVQEAMIVDTFSKELGAK